ncbi:hypothetical protein B0X71_10770 [Planococcus lenghuensis]|uniref:Uncharacterized protein n=1 Tax=Planococcus lenghuensis TaxID=2213202 RepID=A0A1Q2L0C2_9BACL|nr:hypothetical protein B0X71_10770 [Planococcus lenghuensis]
MRGARFPEFFLSCQRFLLRAIFYYRDRLIQFLFSEEKEYRHAGLTAGIAVSLLRYLQQLSQN